MLGGWSVRPLPQTATPDRDGKCNTHSPLPHTPTHPYHTHLLTLTTHIPSPPPIHSNYIRTHIRKIRTHTTHTHPHHTYTYTPTSPHQHPHTHTLQLHTNLTHTYVCKIRTHTHVPGYLLHYTLHHPSPPVDTVYLHGWDLVELAEQAIKQDIEP